MTNKIFSAAIEFEKDGVEVAFDIAMCSTSNSEKAKELFEEYARKSAEYHKIDCNSIALRIKEQNRLEVLKVVGGFTPPQEFIAQTIRTEIRSALNEKADCVSDKFIQVSNDISH